MGRKIELEKNEKKSWRKMEEEEKEESIMHTHTTTITKKSTRVNNEPKKVFIWFITK